MLILGCWLGLSESVPAALVFGPPLNLGTPVNSSQPNFASSISADGLTLYLVGVGSGFEPNIYVATRTTPQSAFGAPQLLPGPVNTPNHYEVFPSVSSDGLELYFNDNLLPGFPQGALRPGGVGGGDIWRATRASVAEAFGQPVSLSINSPSFDLTPAISFDGLTLVFSSARPGGQGNTDLWMATRPSVADPFGAPSSLGPVVNSSANDGTPAFSPDGLTLFFSSDRPGGLGAFDLWMTTRASVSTPFSTPVNLGSPINGSSLELSPHTSSDFSTLYFSSFRPGGVGELDLWQAQIIPEPSAMALLRYGLLIAWAVCVSNRMTRRPHLERVAPTKWVRVVWQARDHVPKQAAAPS
jgi:Tol biopolymer transport system component